MSKASGPKLQDSLLDGSGSATRASPASFPGPEENPGPPRDDPPKCWKALQPRKAKTVLRKSRVSIWVTIEVGVTTVNR